MIRQSGFIDHGESSLVPDKTGDEKKQKTREIREQMVHPYITKQHLKPPLAKGEDPSGGECVKVPKPCD